MTNDASLQYSKQPSVISVFFLTEMWERFGFYMIQGLLVLYMTSSVFGFSDEKSYAILGAFSAVSYVTPILGGYVASSILDFEHAIILGGVLLATGYAMLALPDPHLFYIALAVISIGNGLFKPSISSYLGCFYQIDNPHREKGYTFFYVGINVGVLFSTSTSGYLVRYFGWHTPYLIASVGLCVGILTFILGLSYLKRTNRFNRITLSTANKSVLSTVLVYLNALAFIFFSYEIIANVQFANELMLSVGCMIFIGLFAYAFSFDKETRNKMTACIILILVSIVFWAIYFQMFFSMNLYIERAVDRHFLQFILPTPLFISLQSIFIVIFGSYAAYLWSALAKKNKNPSYSMKFTLAMFSLAIAFFIVYLGTKHFDAQGTTDKLYIVFAYLFVTLGELLLSPIGLSMVTILAPRKLVGLMMGVWFVAIGLGVKLGGVIADFAAIPKEIHSLKQMDIIYGHAFFDYTLLSLFCGFLCLLLLPWLNRMIKPVLNKPQ